ncbi:hypothetical protein [Streptomyces sp. URMC 123]|uniref:hypothetical protein n=1 Tax=Streptomyces sp. URMC 123 TaxID=3423403 RepID=UPI003F1CC481
MPWRRRLAAGATAAVLLPAAGCGELEQRRSAATAAALGFERALGTRDGAAACAALAPGTREELERSAGAPCPRVVLEEEVPAAGNQVRATDVEGRQARVVFGSDTLFLSLFSTGWKVVAAGCAPRPDEPYQCAVKGG